MKLFDVIPGNFFSILSSTNREIYFDAIMILNEMFKDELNIRVDDFLSSLISSLEDKAFILEDDDEAALDGNHSLSSKARLILNKLIKSGWIEKEFIDGSFVEIITPRNYAITIMKTLSEIGDSSLSEYNSLVFATFSGLRQAKTEHTSQMYEAVLSAKANTERLQYALRTLYHAIRGHLRSIVEHQNVNLLLSDHFEEYKKMSDQIYHPIKTMDSVYRYMAPIQSLLTDIIADDELMQNMRERAMTIKKLDHEEADNEIVSAIDYVLDAYQSLGNIVSEIDRKHSMYTKSSIEKIQYLMTADQTIKGKLASLLKMYADGDNGQREALVEKFEGNVRINRQEFVDEKSLYHKSLKARRGDKTPLVLETYDSSLEVLSDEYILENFKNAYSTEKVRSYVESLFTPGVHTISSEDLKIDTDTDFILTILSVIRQSDRGMSYAIEMDEGRVERNGYYIPKFYIHKKEVLGRVD
jgi:hypothetical protein